MSSVYGGPLSTFEDAEKESKVRIHSQGFYAHCSHNHVSNLLTLFVESFPPETSEQPFIPAICRGNRNRCPTPCILYILEGFQALDKQSSLKVEVEKVFLFDLKKY